MFFNRKKNVRISKALMKEIASDSNQLSMYMNIINDIMKGNESSYDKTVESLVKVLMSNTLENYEVCEPIAQTLTIFFLNERKKMDEECWKRYIR